MKNYIFPILLGNNNGSLFGVENDVMLIYNLFYKFYKKIKNDLYKWKKPIMCINEQVNIFNIKKIINKIQYDKKINLIIIIYFSGHSNSKGYLQFYNEKINANNLLENINSVLKQNSYIYFIIDSCFSKNFISNINLHNITKKIYFVSCIENEYSKEIEIEYDKNMFKYKNVHKNNKFIVSIFTLYFIKLLEARNINNILDFKNIINDKLWKMISLKYKQTIYYEELN